MAQQAPHTIEQSLKLRELCQRLSEAIALDNQANSWTNFDAFTEFVLKECMNEIRERYSVSFPALRTRLCNQKQFDQECRTYGLDRDTRAFIVHPLGLVVVNLEEAMKWNAESFVSNLVIDLMEELTHAAFGPAHGELKTKMKVHELTEHYLGITLPEDYKRKSLEKANQQDIENRTRLH
jgi:hypothetical protein